MTESIPQTAVDVAKEAYRIAYHTEAGIGQEMEQGMTLVEAAQRRAKATDEIVAIVAKHIATPPGILHLIVENERLMRRHVEMSKQVEESQQQAHLWAKRSEDYERMFVDAERRRIANAADLKAAMLFSDQSEAELEWVKRQRNSIQRLCGELVQMTRPLACEHGALKIAENITAIEDEVAAIVAAEPTPAKETKPKEHTDA